MNNAASIIPAFHRFAAAQVLTAGSRNTPAALRKISLRTLALAACLLALLSTSLRAQDRILTLSIVNFNSLFSPQLQTVQETLPMMTSLSIRPGESSIAGRPAFQESVSFATTLFFEKPFQPEPVNVNFSARQNGRASSGIWSWVQAGYGQTFYDRLVPAYAQHGAGQEERSYGYLKISFRF